MKVLLKQQILESPSELVNKLTSFIQDAKYLGGNVRITFCLGDARSTPTHKFFSEYDFSCFMFPEIPTKISTDGNLKGIVESRF